MSSDAKVKVPAQPSHEALELASTKQPDDWQRFRAESLLGASLAGQSKNAEAEPLLLEGCKGMLARKDRIAVPDPEKSCGAEALMGAVHRSRPLTCNVRLPGGI